MHGRIMIRYVELFIMDFGTWRMFCNEESKERMITYFERQLKEFEHSIHSLDIYLCDRWVKEGVETLN